MNSFLKILKNNNFLYSIIVKILNVLKKINFFLKHGKYSAKNYWERRGKNFSNEEYQKGIYEQHYWILNKIKKYKPKSILEIGCGFGRNIKFINDNIDYEIKFTGIDISKSLIEESKKFLKSYSNVNLFVTDILSLDLNKKYDLILIHGVFMHISIKDFEINRKFLNNLKYKNLIEVEEVKLNKNGQIKTENINGFTFSHDYLNLNEENNEFKIKNNLIWLDIKK